MLNLKNIDHINMNVSNLEASIHFYQKVFNFEVKEKKEYFSPKQNKNIKYAIIGKSNKGLLALYESDEMISKSSINHFGFYIDNLNSETSKKLHQNGVKVWNYETNYGIIDYKQSTSIYIEDPDGYEIELTNNFGGGL